MKRINIETNKPYKMGDTPTKEDIPKRDELVFYRYDKTRTYLRGTRKDSFYEYWYTPEQVDEKRNKSAIVNDRVIAKLKRNAVREINPETGKAWKRGEVCPDRGTFYNYKAEINRDGKHRMVWAKDQEDYMKKRISTILSVKPKQSKKENVPFDLDLEYLLEIFPKDYICPALGVRMEWGNGPFKPLSPSLDRLIPKKGYVKGNVEWISYRANTIKHDANLEEIEKLYNWLKSVVTTDPATFQQALGDATHKPTKNWDKE